MKEEVRRVEVDGMELSECDSDLESDAIGHGEGCGSGVEPEAAIVGSVS